MPGPWDKYKKPGPVAKPWEKYDQPAPAPSGGWPPSANAQSFTPNPAFDVGIPGSTATTAGMIQPPPMFGQPAGPGPMEPGNIDLTNRPRVKNPDGSISTVRSMSVNLDGKEVLLPTVSDDGRILTPRQAVEQYRKTGRHLGIFGNTDAANAYAQALHEQQAEVLRQQPQNGFLQRAAPTISAVARPALELGGAMGGAALAAPGGPLTAFGGGALGYAGGKSAADLLERGLGLKAPVASVGQALGEIGGNVATGAALEAAGLGVGGAVGAAIPAIRRGIPRAFKQIFGVSEAATKRVLERGARKVLTDANAAEGAAEATLERAQEVMTANRRAAGQLVSDAEDAVTAGGAGDRLFNLKVVAKKLRQSMKELGMSRPPKPRPQPPLYGSTGELVSGTPPAPPGVHGAPRAPSKPHISDLAKDAEVDKLEEIARVFEAGPIAGRDMIKARRLLDDMVSYGYGSLQQVGKQSERLIKGAAADLRKVIGGAYPALKAANAEFGKAAETFDRFFRRFGGSKAGSDANVGATAEAVRRINTKFVQGGEAAREIAAFDDQVARSQEAVAKLFDQLAAGPHPGAFSGKSYRSPSSVVLRALDVSGVTGPSMAGFLLKTGERVGNMATPISPLLSPAFRAALQAAARPNNPSAMPGLLDAAERRRGR